MEKAIKIIIRIIDIAIVEFYPATFAFLMFGCSEVFPDREFGVRRGGTWGLS
jgi:hypothetical protein